MAVGIPEFPTSLDTEVNLVEATNNAQTTLSSTLATGATTISVASTTGFPNTGILKIDDELIAYTSKTSTQFTVQTSNGRGYESTVDAQHSSGTRVELVITAYSNNAKNLAIMALEEKVGVGASTPTAGTNLAVVLKGTGTGTSGWATLTTGDLGFSTNGSGGAAIVLTKDSAGVQQVTGTGNQTFRLPVTISSNANAVALGQSFTFINRSTGILAVQNSASTALDTVRPNQITRFTCNARATEVTTNWTATPVGYVSAGNLVVQAAIDGDAVALQGRAGGTSNYTISLTPATLSASRTLTLPDTTGTVITTGDTSTVTNTMLAGSIANNKLANSTITIAGTSTALGSSISRDTILGLSTTGIVQRTATDTLSTVSTTGSGNVVLATSPTLTTPNLGTPSALTLTSATGLPLSTGVTGTLPAANGGTGLTSPGTSGNVLTSNGTIWTSAAPASGGASVSPSSTRNVLINGGFSVNQRALPDAVTPTTANDTYTLDRWYALTSAGNITVSQQSLQTTSIRNNLRMNQSLGSSQFMGIAQIVEGVNCYWMRGLAVTLSFKVRSPEAARVIRYAVLEWSGSEDLVTSSFVSSWGSTPSWVSGISVASNNIGSASVSAGSTFQSFNLTTTLSSSFNNLIVFIWTDSAVSSTHSVDITEVQLELGSTATVFENERIGSVLERCKRYYYMVARGASERVIGPAAYYSATSLITTINLPVTMRVHPSLEVNNSTGSWFLCYAAGVDDVFTGFNAFGSPGQPANTIAFISNSGQHSVSGISGAGGIVVTWNPLATFALSAEL